MPKFYPVSPRNPALDPFRKRQWSAAAFYVAPPPPRIPRPIRGRAFVSVIEGRRFAVVAMNQPAADRRAAVLFA